MKENNKIIKRAGIFVIILLIILTGIQVVSADCDFSGPLGILADILAGKFKCLAVHVLNIIMQQILLDNFLNVVFDGIKYAILINPNPDDVQTLLDAYITFLHPLYSLMIVITGFYLIFMSGSPAGRAKAKQSFWKLILSMVLVTISLDIFKLLLRISLGLSRTVLSTSGATDFTLGGAVLAYIPICIFAVPVVLLCIVSIGIRYLLVLIFAALFPFTLFLYMSDILFFDFLMMSGLTKRWGAKLFRLTLGAIFAQVVQAAMLAITIVSFNSMASNAPGYGTLVALMVGIMGLFLIGIAPLFTMMVLQYIGAFVMAAGMVVSMVPGYGTVLGPVLTTAGGLMQGMSPGAALMAGGGTAAFGRLASMQRSMPKAPPPKNNKQQ